jgi:hypothetical protein
LRCPSAAVIFRLEPPRPNGPEVFVLIYVKDAMAGVQVFDMKE